MRLIDADKLMESLKPKESVWVGLVLSELIDNAPTVKAIPIEWFKKKIGFLFENQIYGAEVYQWVLNRWYEDKEDWEKENENRVE